ncbi:MAG: selenide, water dikinase SelD, partial [Phycisphaerales bacterium JB038]
MKIDYAKRRRVMERSRRLGHCICDPKRPCPCDVFTDQGICPCAGERPDPIDPATVRLTELVRNAGCASKIAPTDLEGVLSRLPAVDDPAVIAGLAASDDAGVYQLSDDARVVQTIDVMTPCVDDAELFGRICAANCLSDVYAMGGVPRTALSLVAFDTDGLHTELMYLQLKGAMEAFAEAGVALLGGHSIKDTEPKLGFAITGTMDAAADAVLQGSARADDVLVLTKPLGVGTLNFARQIGRADEATLQEMQDWMAMLN